MSMEALVPKKVVVTICSIVFVLVTILTDTAVGDGVFSNDGNEVMVMHTAVGDMVTAKGDVVVVFVVGCKLVPKVHMNSSKTLHRHMKIA